MKSHYLYLIITAFLFMCCNRTGKQSHDITGMFTGKNDEVKLITLDPGHIHAALVQKTMYAAVDPVVHVYAPDGMDVKEHMARIEGYNSRKDNPTEWIVKLYTGPDFLERMISEKAGNVVVISGNNARKTEYIHTAVKNGFNVLADKPMIITADGFPLLMDAFNIAKEKGLLLYDIMTERYEITTILQKELSLIPQVFGTLSSGTAGDPSITKESVHHFFKYVSGKPLVRPAWFYDTRQQGEGIADVTTHLIDLIQWEAFPEQKTDTSEIEIISARRWATPVSPGEFKLSTGLDTYPGYLEDYINGGILNVCSNGEIIYRIKGIYAKVSVIWNFRAPEGAGDTHYSMMKGTRSSLVINQGPEEKYMPELYILFTGTDNPDSFSDLLSEEFKKISARYPGVTLVRTDQRKWQVEIPESYRVGHEAHFGQVTEKYLDYLQEGKMPEWEIPCMITKYFTIVRALEKAQACGQVDNK